MIAIPIIISIVLTFVITNRHLMKHYHLTIEYKNKLIDELSKDNHRMREAINKSEYNLNVKIM